MTFKKAVERQKQIHNRLMKEIDEGLQNEGDYRKWYSDDPPTLPTVDVQYVDSQQLAAWRQERG